MNVTEAIVHRIAVCYPTESLSRQVDLWAQEHEDCGIERVFARTVPGIRQSLGGADLVLVDATDDHAQAIDLFSQTVARFGSRHVAVYTERVHEGLELFVRTQGVWLLLGPLNRLQWEQLFASAIPSLRRQPLRHDSPGREAA